MVPQLFSPMRQHKTVGKTSRLTHQIPSTKMESLMPSQTIDSLMPSLTMSPTLTQQIEPSMDIPSIGISTSTNNDHNLSVNLPDSPTISGLLNTKDDDSKGLFFPNPSRLSPSADRTSSFSDESNGCFIMVKTTDPVDDIPTGLKLFIKNLHSLTPEKLNDSNFPSWFSTVSANLSAHRFMEYVDGTMEAPPSTLTVTVDAAPRAVAAAATAVTPNPNFEKWSVVDAQLRACLLAIISPSVQNHLHGLTSTAAIWNHLQLRYNSVSRTHIFQLKEQLHGVQKGNDSMQKYLDSVVTIVAALDRAKSGIPEQDSGQSVGYRGGRGRGSNRARGGPLVVVALHVVVGGLPTVSSTEAASRKVAAVL
uniref:Retrotransposon Copia-like N-terminal domain-containing protein n=1 Tax=Solanum lycopersicum TaxID=4081 RepID=A0A3Q7GLA8_SOLLC